MNEWKTTSEVLQDTVDHYRLLYGISLKEARKQIRRDLLNHLDIANTQERLDSMEAQITNA